MIDYDTTALPFTLAEWTAFLTAVDGAAPEDESDWIEFKANLDLNNKIERPVLAKAIVAFANREVSRASKHLGGRAVITVGLEPGKVVDVRIDPADLTNWLDPYLGDPSPRWTPHYVGHKGQQVLVVIVDAPKQGDPIYCIAKAGGDQNDAVRAGEIYVRHFGKSEPQTPADLQMLTARMRPQPGIPLEIEVIPCVDGGITLTTVPTAWIEMWLERERRRLMQPLAPKRKMPSPGGLYPESSTLAAALAATNRMSSLMAGFEAANPFEVRHEETRSEEAYAAEVADYLEECRRELAPAVDDLRKAIARPVAFDTQNLTDENFQQLEVRLHLEGDVEAFDWHTYFGGVQKYIRTKPPRLWGPRIEKKHRLPDALLQATRHAAAMPRTATYEPAAPSRPRPTIVNGGSADLTFPPVHLRPHSRTGLESGLFVVAGDSLDADVRCTWSATATNARGVQTGSFTIPVAETRTDLGPYLAHGARLTVPSTDD